MLTRKIALTTANRFLADLKAFGVQPTKAILFGSVAKGSQHEWSDIDLAVWAPEFIGVLGIDYETIMPVLRPYRELELHTFAPDETAESNPFVEHIEKTGIALTV